MRKRIRQRVLSFLKRWPYWILQFLGWLLFLVRDNYATTILVSLNDKYGGKVIKDVLLILPRDATGYAFLLLAGSVFLILAYDFIDTRKKTDSSRKPPSEKLFKVTSRPPLPKQPDEFRWASLTVENLSEIAIENCFLTLDTVVDKDGESRINRQRKLSWSAGEGLDGRPVNKELQIVKNVPRVCDVATTWPRNTEVMYTTWSGNQTIPIGRYKLKISIHGQRKGKQISKTYSFIMIYEGGNDLSIKTKEKQISVLPTKSVKSSPNIQSELQWVAVVYPKENIYGDHIFTWAAIRIDNEIDCRNLDAQLIKVTKQVLGNGEELDINKINPTGDDLMWNTEEKGCILHIVREHAETAEFVFKNGRKSPPLAQGEYEIEILITGDKIKKTSIVKKIRIKKPRHYIHEHKTGLDWL